MSSDTETPKCKSGKLCVEQQQSAGDDCWRSARHLGQVARAIQVPFRLRWSSDARQGFSFFLCEFRFPWWFWSPRRFYKRLLAPLALAPEHPPEAPSKGPSVTPRSVALFFRRWLCTCPTGPTKPRWASFGVGSRDSSVIFLRVTDSPGSVSPP